MGGWSGKGGQSQEGQEGFCAEGGFTRKERASHKGGTPVEYSGTRENGVPLERQPGVRLWKPRKVNVGQRAGKGERKPAGCIGQAARGDSGHWDWAQSTAPAVQVRRKVALEGQEDSKRHKRKGCVLTQGHTQHC